MFWFLSIVVALVSYRFVVRGMDQAYAGTAHQLLTSEEAFYLHIIAGSALFACNVPRDANRHARSDRASSRMADPLNRIDVCRCDFEGNIACSAFGRHFNRRRLSSCCLALLGAQLDGR